MSKGIEHQFVNISIPASVNQCACILKQLDRRLCLEQGGLFVPIERVHMSPFVQTIS